MPRLGKECVVPEDSLLKVCHRTCEFVRWFQFLFSCSFQRLVLWSEMSLVILSLSVFIAGWCGFLFSESFIRLSSQ